jgi:hypothetical protein
MDLPADLNLETSPPLAVGSRAHKRAHAKHKRPENCQNCDAKLEGEFCHSCGQTAHVHRSMGHVLEEIIHGITHFDSRTWRSLPMLLVRPGTLTRNYVMGKRARYVPPFAMFLASVFAMFLAFAFSGGPSFVSEQAATASQVVQDASERVADLQTEVTDAETELKDAQTELAKVRADPDPMPGEEGSAIGAISSAEGSLTGARARLKAAQNDLTRARNGAAAQRQATATGSPSFPSAEDKTAALADIEKELAEARQANSTVEISALTLAKQVAQAAPIIPKVEDTKTNETTKNPKGVTVKLDVGQAGGEVVVGQASNIMGMLKDSMRRGDFVVTPWPEINKKIAEKTKNPDLFLYKLQNTVYKFSFLLVPLSLPFIWLMFFWKKNVTLFDHAVFALYSLSFVSFLFLTVSVLGHWLPIGQVSGYAALILPVHLFFQFKGAYQLSWFSALWRTLIFGSTFAWVILTAFLLVIIALGVTG